MRKYFFIIIATLLYLTGLLSSFPYILSEFWKPATTFTSLRTIIEYSVMYLSLLAFCYFLHQNKILKFFSYVIQILLSISFLLSTSCFIVYGTGFNIGIGLSILSTNINEAKSMSFMFIIPTILTIIYTLIQYKSIQLIDDFKNKKTLIALSTLWILLPVIFYLKHTYIENKGGAFMIKSAFYQSNILDSAIKTYEESKLISKKSDIKIIKSNNPPTQNIILVIGESVRKQNMSLYGYDKPTNPYSSKEKNLTVYPNVVSSASITNLSVPLILSSIEPKDFVNNYSKLSNNIITYANKNNYNTYWYTTQGPAKGITAIANLAKTKEWISGFDDVLYPKVANATSKTLNNLIILHINGSHPNPCDRTPPDFDEKNLDCYDASIYYTDTLLKKLYDKYRYTNTIIIYTSDHGLKIKDNKFLHTDSKESTQVPLFVWYGDKVNPNYILKSASTARTQNTIVYPLIVEYMGLEPLKNYKSNKNDFLDLSLNSIKYENLPE